MIDDSGRGSPTEEISKFSSQAPTAVDGLREGYQALANQLVETGNNFLVIPEEEFQKWGAAGLSPFFAESHCRLCNRNYESRSFGTDQASYWSH